MWAHRLVLSAVLAVALLAVPLNTEAQQAGTVYRVGLFHVGLKIAKALEITIPQPILLQADQVIEQ